MIAAVREEVVARNLDVAFVGDSSPVDGVDEDSAPSYVAGDEVEGLPDGDVALVRHEVGVLVASVADNNVDGAEGIEYKDLVAASIAEVHEEVVEVVHNQDVA